MAEPNRSGYLMLDGVRYVTTAEAAQHFAPDVTEDMIRDWTKRGILKPAGRFGNRSNIYRLVDVAMAERRTHAEQRGRKRQSGNLHNSGKAGQNLSAEPLAKAAQKTVVCAVFDEVGDGCHFPAYPDAPFPLCEEHILSAYRFWDELRRERAAVRNAAKAAAARAEFDAERDAWHEEQLHTPTVSHVYYLRFGDRYKIGVTTSLARRLSELPHDELVAVEPGDVRLEGMRHKQFAGSRVPQQREWFFLTPELDSHMSMLVEHYGTPDQVRGRTHTAGKHNSAHSQLPPGAR